MYHHIILMFQQGPGRSMGQVVELPNNSHKPITNTAWVRARLCKLQKGCTRLASASDKAYQLLVHVRCFSPSTPVSSTTKTGRHDIAEILLKVALNNKNQSINLMFQYECFTICVYTFSRHYYSCNTCSHDVKYKQSINKLKEE